MDQSRHKKRRGVIIAGGSGYRLFGISTPDRPKQFCRLNDKDTFIQATVSRLNDLEVEPNRIMIVTTNQTQSELAREQTVPMGVLSQNILEFSPHLDYAGSMVKAKEMIRAIDKDATIINTPSDQYIVANESFKKSINNAVAAAEHNGAALLGVKIGDLVTAMGCGHATYDNSSQDQDGCFPVSGFIEKPSRDHADRLMRSDNSVCNTGILVWRADYMADELNSKRIGRNGLATDALMKKLIGLKVAVGRFPWHDCGTLKSFYEISKKSPNHKNASLGGGTFERIDCHRSLLYAEPGMELRVAGARDDAIIFTIIKDRPAIIVARLDESQHVKTLAEDFLKHDDFLSEDFSFGARNNTVLCSNISDDLIAGFVGVENYATYVTKEPDGRLIAVVSQQKRR